MTPLTWNSDSQKTGPIVTTRVWGKWHNYLSESGWKRIDLSIRQAGGRFAISKAPYSIDVPQIANDWLTLESTNRYDIWNKLERSDAKVGIQKRYPTALAVTGIATASGILFAGAFPSLNADRLVQLHEQEVRDLIVFNSEPPGHGPVEVPIEISPEGLPALKSLGRGQLPEEANFNAPLDIEKGLSFTNGTFRGIKIKEPRVWDSVGRSVPIKLRLRQDGSRLVGNKVIPRVFFANAIYPVYADTTTTFYPDPNPETTTVDGQVKRVNAAGETWTALRGGAGTEAHDTNAALSIVQLMAFGSGSTWESMARGILLFDTSAIPDTDTIESANFAMKVDTVQDGFNAGLSVVASTPASNTALVSADYSQLGTTKFASDVDFGDYTEEAYESHALNATGLAAISKTGVTKLGTRLVADVDNVEPTWSAAGEVFIHFHMADVVGTDEDPYLEVVHIDEHEATLPYNADASDALIYESAGTTDLIWKSNSSDAEI